MNGSVPGAVVLNVAISRRQMRKLFPISRVLGSRKMLDYDLKRPESCCIWSTHVRVQFLQLICGLGLNNLRLFRMSDF